MKTATTFYKTPIGIAKITGSQNGIKSIFVVEENEVSNDLLNADIPPFLKECVTQLKEYFNGKRTQFTIKIDPKGTPFQLKVWEELLKIDYGKTTTYLSQSNALGNAKALRAVAAANGKNPLWIIVPCHRVIGSDGSLTGYAGGIWRKKWLLAHENPVKQQTLF